MTDPNEQTLDPRKARKALEESRASRARIAPILADARRTFSEVRDHRERNHYADKFRTIIRGSAAS